MDEIVIGEKKYVSSKQAAKMTGYAKDYVGQLCREGRVPARLVGRSWYVLESALQDHRFGDKKTEQETPADKEARVSPLSTWEHPHYEASEVEALPSMYRQDNDFSSEPEKTDETATVEHLRDSWRAWFDYIGATKETTPAVEERKDDEMTTLESDAVESAVAQEQAVRASDTNIPIHVVYEPPPRELLPETAKKTRRAYTDLDEKANDADTQYHPIISPSRFIIRTVLAAGFIFTISIASLAVANSGYFDKFIVSLGQASVIGGIHLYNKYGI